DEMMVVFFAYVAYEPGDENIVLDPTTSVGEPLNPSMPMSLFPNPAEGNVELSAWLPDRDLKIQVLNQMGDVVKTIFEGNQPKGAYATTIDISDLSQGIYFVQLQSGGER